MNPPSLHHHRPLARPVLMLGLTLLLTACETPINALRAQRFDQGHQPAVPAVQPRALALALRAAPDGRGLATESVKQANEMLSSQGRLGAQTLTITPFNARGERLAARLATALERSGARKPTVAPLADAQRLAEAAANDWDLELQSEAITVDMERCAIADSSNWTIHPFHGIGALGCANRANIARMVSDPQDLQRPRTLDSADGAAAALAVKRYQEGEIRELIDIDFDND
ncbi:CpaD family pilus assembly lipoprotein [Thauera linaloolentis]|uniref:Lipoprotein n=1 Tax=Thauera linaloolentis (strain DSM 12138 / JCM 21573 / CCUG 41526 / CIP 105981 / IAM 15112 / NBRC 102519 / 47Lol) TaxID=1123367 RepID=N6YZ19_THAL4|nr:CpaD family pilus assembly lipoprotein [Thauera linaloolentis]ENO87637.1 lipoprotein [Thauera linaloolentis 47Lol = DSM 12138]MCM8565965.1 CpaD family pilus assembly lipoprotein [Thauera linaloolentis]